MPGCQSWASIGFGSHVMGQVRCEAALKCILRHWKSSCREQTRCSRDCCHSACIHREFENRYQVRHPPRVYAQLCRADGSKTVGRRFRVPSLPSVRLPFLAQFGCSEFECKIRRVLGDAIFGPVLLPQMKKARSPLVFQESGFM